MTAARWVLVFTIAALLVSCAGGGDGDDGVVEGTVTQVTGQEDVMSFIVTDDDGRHHRFEPRPGLTCDGEDLTHLRDHVVDRDRIAVRWTETASGAIAESIEHLDD